MCQVDRSFAIPVKKTAMEIPASNRSKEVNSILSPLPVRCFVGYFSDIKPESAPYQQDGGQSIEYFGETNPGM